MMPLIDKLDFFDCLDLKRVLTAIFFYLGDDCQSVLVHALVDLFVIPP